MDFLEYIFWIGAVLEGILLERYILSDFKLCLDKEDIAISVIYWTYYRCMFLYDIRV